MAIYATMHAQANCASVDRLT
uniref:Uncharacterized protein n=1 Tax=Arundo donax TaxID=35708 RepID=A0A0A9FVR4_ARUDO